MLLLDHRVLVLRECLAVDIGAVDLGSCRGRCLCWIVCDTGHGVGVAGVRWFCRSTIFTTNYSDVMTLRFDLKLRSQSKSKRSGDRIH